MSIQPPIIEAEEPSEADKRLVATFADIESKQLDFLDQAGKSIIERSVGLLAVVFAVSAFGDKFPPPYLHGNLLAKVLLLTSMACYIVAMFCGMRAIQPRFYKRYEYNLQGMRQELRQMVKYKAESVQWAGVLFWAGSCALAALIVVIIFRA